MSFQGFPVMTSLGFVLPFTVLLLVLGIGGAVGAGFVVGRFLGWRQSIVSDGMLAGAAVMSTLFPPWLVFMLAYAAAGIVGFEGMISLRSFDSVLWESGGLSLTAALWLLVAGLMVSSMVVWLVGRWLARRPFAVRGSLQLAVLIASAGLIVRVVGLPRLADLGALIVLPLVAVILTNVGDATIVAATLTDAQRHAAYVQTARAKGLTEREITLQHVGRNVVLPILARYVASLPLVFGLLLIIESSFGNQAEYSVFLPGIGQTVFFSLIERDMPVVLGGLLLVGAITLIARLVLDIIQAVLDPRLRHTIHPGLQP
jgi:ABC-type dipeptide/oligopeptide/nickel transport system permease component